MSQGLGSLLGHVVGEGSGPQEGLGLAEEGEQNTPSIGHVLASMGLGSPRPCSLALEQRAPHASGVCPSKSHPGPSGTPTPLGFNQLSALLSRGGAAPSGPPAGPLSRSRGVRRSPVGAVTPRVP